MSRADSRVRPPGTLTCARCPAVTSALDAGPEAYHNPAAVWWGAFAASPVIRDQVVIVKPIVGLSGQHRQRQVPSLEGRVAQRVGLPGTQVSRCIASNFLS